SYYLPLCVLKYFIVADLTVLSVIVFNTTCVFPKAFQVVEFPVFVLKNMHHHIYVIYKRPVVSALHMVRRLLALFFYYLLHIVGYGFQLYVRLGLAKYKEISY